MALFQLNCCWKKWFAFIARRGRAGGAKVQGKLPVPGSPANLDDVGQGTIALAVGVGRGCLDIFLSSIISLFFLPLSGRRPDID